MDGWFWCSGISSKDSILSYHVLAKPVLGVSDLCLLGAWDGGTSELCGSATLAIGENTPSALAGQRAGVGQGTI